MDNVIVNTKTPADPQSESNDMPASTNTDKKVKGKWEQRFHTAGALLSCIMKILPKN